MRISKESFAKSVNDYDRKSRYISVIITEVRVQIILQLI